VREHAERAGTATAVSDLLSENGLGVLELLALTLSLDEDATLAEIDSVAQIVGTLHPEFVLTVVNGPPEKAVDLVRRAADAVAEHGAVIALEVMPITPLQHVSQAVTLARVAGRDNVGVLLDTWHFFMGPSEWSELASLDADDIACVQVNDGRQPIAQDLSYETRHRRTMPGRGIFDLSRFGVNLRTVGFDGAVSVEVLDAERRDPTDIAGFIHDAFHAATALITGWTTRDE
jgi:sugar phosphate isomerase/epimerase